MKPFRVVHLIFGVLALIPLLLIAAALVLPPFQNAESSRIEGLQKHLQEQLEVIIGEKAELKKAVEQAEQRLMFVPIPSPNNKNNNVFTTDPTPLKMVMDMKQRVQVSLHFPLKHLVFGG